MFRVGDGGLDIKVVVRGGEWCVPRGRVCGDSVSCRFCLVMRFACEDLR